MDVKTTFLNGDLEEEIYMKQPEGSIVLGQGKKVCKLVKFLFELKQHQNNYTRNLILS